MVTADSRSAGVTTIDSDVETGTTMATALMVWIDQDLCTGDGICSEICPDVFEPRDDGLWVVREDAAHFGKTIVFDGAPTMVMDRTCPKVWPAFPMR